MPSGRLGSAKLNPSRAALLYSNTSASPASVSIQATTLSTTENTNLALSIDSATVAVNETTVATALTAGSMSQRVRWLDPLSNNNVLRFERSTTNQSNGGDVFPVSFWDGTNFVKTGVAIGSYGAKNWQKIDPYFLTNPSAYGKSQASIVLGFQYNTSVDSMRFRHYDNLATFTGQQFRLSQMWQDPGVAAYSYSRDESYGGFGFAVDPYTDYVATTGNQGFSSVFYGKTGNPSYGTSSNSIPYQMFSAQNLSNFNHHWYAPRIMGSKGLFLYQPTGLDRSTVYISDFDLAVAEGNLQRALIWDGTANTSWWSISLNFSGEALVQWFEYNPNTDRYYMQMADHTGTAANQNRNIYSFTRAGIKTNPERGNNSGIQLASNPIFTNHGRAPWGTTRVERPQRIGASLWWTVTETDVAYVSEDLVTWQTATTYFAAQGEAANTFNKAQINSTSYLYAQANTADVKKFDSKFTLVSETSVIEYNTSVNNYQRTGLVLSAGDKLYAQNYGNVALSITAMGFEGS